MGFYELCESFLGCAFDVGFWDVDLDSGFRFSLVIKGGREENRERESGAKRKSGNCQLQIRVGATFLIFVCREKEREGNGSSAKTQ